MTWQFKLDWKNIEGDDVAIQKADTDTIANG